MADAVTIESLHEGIKQALSEAFTELKTVDDYPTEKGRIATPAAFLDLAALEPDAEGGEDGTERLVMTLRWELYLVLGLPVPEVKRAVRTLAANVALWVQGNRFGLPVRPAQFIRAEPNDFSPGLERYLPWVVEFEQTVLLGSSVWDADGVVPTELYLGYEPNTGPDHIDDYERVTGDELPSL